MFWKRKKENTPILSDYSVLGVDLHSHLLPGLDDGARTMEDSLQIIAGLQSLGYRKIITTPHNQADFYVNPPEKILASLKTVRQALKENQIDIEIEAASEYYFDYDFLHKIQKKELLTFGNNYVLFELSPTLPPVNFESIVFELQVAGYRPVLAHPERYGYFHGPGKYRELTEKGILLQVNISSLSSHIASNIRNAAIKIVQENLASFAGSDTHNMANISIMKDLLSSPHVYRLLDSGVLMNAGL